MSLLVREIVAISEEHLKEAGIEEYSHDARALYCYMANIEKMQIILEFQRELSDEICEKYFALVQRRLEGEPLQYITGKAYAMGLEFHVDKNVLIPRQDTETLIEETIKIINENKIKKVLDLCTGSGLIGISISKAVNKSDVVCADISKEAVDMAQRNALHNNVYGNITFQCGDLFQPFKSRFKNKKFGIIVSNPPYIKSEVIPTLTKEVKDYEPITALDGGKDGLDFYKRIISEAPNHLKKEGYLLLEIGYDQKEEVIELLNSSNKFTGIYTIKDLRHLDRVIVAKLEG